MGPGVLREKGTFLVGLSGGENFSVSAYSTPCLETDGFFGKPIRGFPETVSMFSLGKGGNRQGYFGNVVGNRDSRIGNRP
jgi:hypothetical protein